MGGTYSRFWVCAEEIRVAKLFKLRLAGVLAYLGVS